MSFYIDSVYNFSDTKGVRTKRLEVWMEYAGLSELQPWNQEHSREYMSSHYKMRAAGRFVANCVVCMCNWWLRVKELSNLMSGAIIYIRHSRIIPCHSVGETSIGINHIWPRMSMRRWPFLHVYNPTFICNHWFLGMSSSMTLRFGISTCAVAMYRPAYWRW